VNGDLAFVADYFSIQIISITDPANPTHVGSAGAHSATWDGADNQGRRLPAGMYLCKLRAGSFESTQRMLLLP